MNVLIENVKRCEKGNWYAVFDVVLVFQCEGGPNRTIRIGCCGAELLHGGVYFRLPTKTRDTGAVYQLNFFDGKTWQEIINKVEKEFEGAIAQ